MKKKKILLGLAMAAAAVFSLSACGDDTPTDTPSGDTPQETTKYTVTFNTNGGSTVNSQSIEQGKKVTKPADPTKTATDTVTYTFAGWFKDAALTQAFNFDTDTINAATTLYAKWTETAKQDAKEYEEVTYKLIAEDFSAGAVADVKYGQFTLVGGEVRGRTKSWTDPEDSANTKTWTTSFKNGPISVYAPGNGTLSMYLQNGSSGAATQIVKITASTGETQNIEFSGATTAVAPYGTGSPVVKIDLEVKEGVTYTVERGNGGTIDWYEFDMTCQVEKSDESGFEIVSTGNVDFLLGEDFDSSKLVLNKVFKNGKTDTLDVSQVTVDSSNYKKDESGTYTISVTYGNYDAITYEVNVWDVESIELGFDATYKGKSTSAGNGTYVNGKVKKLYALNEQLDTTYLSVIANAKLGDKTENFLINGRSSENSITYGTLDTASAGKKDVNVTYTFGTKSANTSYEINVVDTAPVKNSAEEYIVNVNASYTGAAGAADSTLGNQFATIGDALEFLSRSDIDAATRKILTIEAGTYNEKLEITVPYLTIVGAGADTTKIEWDSLYGIPDASGYLQVTDSTQTVAVRESAVGCIIKDITISNWWNSEEHFQSKLDLLSKYGLYTTKVNEHRALALLVMSDKFIMENTSLLGYQDTVEFFKGRQYLKNCYIEGTTDFIFGTNNTTLFEQCEIHTIYNGSTSGGYTTAFKGCSSGATDAVDYGAIFYQCRFTADAEVGTGENANTALGRPWGAYAAVAFIECELGDHFSKKPSTGANQNERYVAMTVTATAETVKFVEYGNTGLGAIGATQAGMTYLATKEDADKYHDFAVIFNSENGHVSYQNAWDPTDSTIVADNSSYYYFNGSSSPTGKTYSSNLEDTNTIDEKIFTIGDMTFDASAGGRVMARSNGDLMVVNGAKITFDVKANTLVEITSYPSYYFYSINGVNAAANTVKQFYDADTTISIESTGNTFYLYSIIITPNAEQPTFEINGLSVSGLVKDYKVGATFDDSKLSVSATYNNGTAVKLNSTDYQIDLTNVDFATAGEYDAKIVYGSTEYTFKVKVNADTASYIEGNLTLSFKDDAANAAPDYLVYDDSAINPTLQIGKFTLIDTGSGVVANNGDWLKFNTGAKAEFLLASKATMNITFYQNNNNVKVTVNGAEVTPDESNNYALTAGKVVIEATASGYLGKIAVNAGFVVTSNLTLSFKDDAANAAPDYLVYDDSAINPTLQIGKFTLIDTGSGVVANNGDWLKFNTGAKVVFNTATNANLAISFYQNNNNVKVTVNGTEVTPDGSNNYTLTAGEVVIEAISSGYLGKIDVNAGLIVDSTQVLSFKDDATNAAPGYLVYDDSAINPTLQIGNFTLIDNGNGVVANNGDWLKFNTGGKVVFNTIAATTMNITFYQNNNNVKVTVNGTEVTPDESNNYALAAGEVVIEAISSGYLGKITVTY